MPRRYSFAEETIKSAVKTFARRGKIEVSVMVENIGDEEVNIRLNPAVAKQYLENIRELKEILGIGGDVTLEYIASLPDVMKSVPDVENEEEIAAILVSVVSDCLLYTSSEDEHRADAEAHGEETLIHRCHQCIEHSVFLHFSEIRLEIKLETFRRSFKRHAPDRQHDDQKEQSYHHTFGNSLETFLKPPGADKETENYGKERPSAHFDRICKQIAVSYTHLDVYKRQRLSRFSPEAE